MLLLFAWTAELASEVLLYGSKLIPTLTGIVVLWYLSIILNFLVTANHLSTTLRFESAPLCTYKARWEFNSN